MDSKVKVLMLRGEKGEKGEKGDPGGSATWGDIIGTLADQTDLSHALNDKANIDDLGTVSFTNSYSDLDNKPNLSAVAISGSYDDLDDKPILSTVATSGSYDDLDDKPSLATVATSGDYEDLTNKPTIPTKTSELINDSNYVKSTNLASVATSGDYEDLINKPTIPAITDIVNAIYPVGSYYWTSEDISPDTIFGGTWEKIEDVFLLAASDTYAVDSTGGEATHKLTKDELPSHSHRSANTGGYTVYGGDDTTDGPASGTGYRLALYNLFTSSIGGNQPHNNMPPYKAAFCWHRTA